MRGPKVWFFAAFCAAFGAPRGAHADAPDLAKLRAATRKDATDAEASFALGHALRNAGLADQAVSELLRGGSTKRAWASGTVGAFWLEIARVRIDERDPKAAFVACKNVPPVAKALEHVCRAEAFLSMNRASEALPEAEAALAITADLADALIAKGRALSLSGKGADADTLLQSLTARADAPAEAHHQLAFVQKKAGNTAGALASLKRARELDPACPFIAFDLGDALGNTSDAAVALRAAVAIRPSFAQAHARLAEVALALGDLATADEAAQAAARLDPSLPAAQLALGRTALRKGDADAALAAADAARKGAPYAPAVELLCAEAHLAKGELDLAAEAFLKAYSLDNEDPSPLLRAARAYLDAGRTTSARGYVDKVTASFPTWGPAWELLGDIEAKKGASAKARAAYETALTGEGPVDKDAVKRKLAALP